ncbi:DUF2970 domain-containing protein [Shewanella salipaludis]|uniref:DUF2970 domain-containing protein n=1 Tax=Shewanella salipaludis TaxID=2723052 RepID=A0A972JIJ2_9GAMM|nr:DUF2970 domain-containing protein [Shewanella salipaludis]NMH65093.1 DUF2970 domain-containing protein [Shewanella salipaludis]
MLRRLWQVFCSTLAAFFGVQTDANRVRDFQQNSPLAFIIMGIVMALVLVMTLIFIVQQVLA